MSVAIISGDTPLSVKRKQEIELCCEHIVVHVICQSL